MADPVQTEIEVVGLSAGAPAVVVRWRIHGFRRAWAALRASPLTVVFLALPQPRASLAPHLKEACAMLFHKSRGT
jgi:hypothetical protein